MDPIEKLLSELAPARARNDLDNAMDRLFRRADRKKSLQRVAGVTLLAFVMLAVGGWTGYRFGSDTATPPPASTITYIFPVESTTHRPTIDAAAAEELVDSVGRSETGSGSIIVTMFNKDTV